MSSTKKTGAYLAWGCAVLFFFYQYILRVIPGVMQPVLITEFGITAEQFSTLGAYYLYAYGLSQIPVGLITDRVGVKNTMLGSILLCLVGAGLLGETRSFELAQLSRILMGIGSACAFMGCLKVVADNFEPGRRGVLMGATLALGTLGPLSAGAPLTLLMDQIGWRGAILFLLVLGILMFFITLFFMRDPKDLIRIHQPVELSVIRKDVFDAFQNRSVMLYAFLAIALYTPLSVVSDLWGVAFLMQKYGFGRAEAANVCMSMYAGLCVGSLLMSWIAEKYDLLNRMILISGFISFAMFVVLIFGPSLQSWCLVLILFTIGAFCGAEMLCFMGVSFYANSGKSGVTLGVANSLNMLGGAFLQHGIGIILDFLWIGQVDGNGAREYSTQAYQAALSVLLVVIGFSCCVAFLLPQKKEMCSV